MPELRPTKERLRRLGTSLWPVRNCWKGQSAPANGARVSKSKGQSQRARSLREIRVSLARKLEAAMSYHDEMLDAMARLRVCNALVKAAAEELDVLACPDLGSHDDQGGGEGRLDKAVEGRRRGWRDHEEAWGRLYEAHEELLDPLDVFGKGIERDLIPPRSIKAVSTFISASKALQMSRQEGQKRHKKIGDIDAGSAFPTSCAGTKNPPSKSFSIMPTKNEQRYLDDLELFYQVHASGILRALSLLSADPKDIRRRRQSTAERGDDGMTVQERYDATQRALANYFPRPSPPPLRPQDQRLQQDLWHEYEDAQEALGDAWAAYIESRDGDYYWREAREFLAAYPEGNEDDVAQGMLKRMNQR